MSRLAVITRGGHDHSVKGHAMRRENERDEYLTRVEEFICQRRLSPLFLSPKEWAVAQGWKDDEIPLVVVFQGIEKAERSLPSDGGEFSKRRLTLSYCNR